MNVSTNMFVLHNDDKCVHVFVFVCVYVCVCVCMSLISCFNYKLMYMILRNTSIFLPFYLTEQH